MSKRRFYRFFGLIITMILIILIFIATLSHTKNKEKISQLLPNMPAISNPTNIYSEAGIGMLSSVVRSALNRVYVPNSLDNTVSVIDPNSFKVIDVFKTDKNPQHIVPSYDLKTLWVLNDKGNSVTPIDPTSALPGNKLYVDDPYNLYFTPDGRFAIVVDEAKKQFDFRDPQTMMLLDSVPVKCKGVNHLDFTIDGRYAIATCEFSGELLKFDVLTHKILGYLNLNLPAKKSMPQDIRSTPDGKIFYVADMMRDGVFLIDPVQFTQIGFIATGKGTHSIYPSRDGKLFYVANRGCNHSIKCAKQGPGSISVINPKTQKIIATWVIPGGGSPDMGNVSADGKQLWLSGRYDAEVYVFDTQTGQLLQRIPVGRGPHGLTVWPQPGRFSLGHTGNMR